MYSYHTGQKVVKLATRVTSAWGTYREVLGKTTIFAARNTVT